ncbi:MAG TPA: lantibiotic dehydratase [Thermoanaerobaculia bacterium]|nr:lantibiotic dehydratase [Thermoanaerobaculia bacterium]
MARNELSFQPSGFFVLRTPLLPFREFSGWSEGLRSPDTVSDPEALGEALRADRKLLRERLAAWIEKAEVREALFVASPSLSASLSVWRSEPDSERGRKVERSLTRYFARMCGRPTPFGLFAGCSVGTLGSKTALRLAPRAEYRRYTRLDNDYLFSLGEELVKNRSLRLSLTFFPNSSLYFSGEKWRYAESRLRDRFRSYHLVGISPTPYIDATLEWARDGATFQSLATCLIEMDAEISQEDAIEFLHELVDSQVLVATVAPLVTGAEPLADLLAQLTATAPAGDVRKVLSNVRKQLASLDCEGVGQAPEAYETIARMLAMLPAKVDFARLFQVDMVKPVEVASLGPAVLEEINKAVNLLSRICETREHDELVSFREAFVARYEAREVPLVEVLDDEIGIGFGGSREATADADRRLREHPPMRPAADSRVQSGPFSAYRLHLLVDALVAGKREIELTEHDLDKMTGKAAMPLPLAFHAMVALAGASPEAIARGEFQMLIDHVGGPSGARLFGRFCHWDPVLDREVRSHLRAEEALRSDAVFAEIVHLPDGRVGNLLVRPALRDREITYLGRSGVPRDRQILLTDLLVSVVGGAIRLRSRSLGVEVIPRMTTAHSFVRGLAPYRFLCHLQSQGCTPALKWTWGVGETLPFLPRVRYGRIVLSRARWLVSGSEIEPLAKAGDAARYALARAWRKSRGLPRIVQLAEFENELPVDFDNPLSLDTFVQLVRGRSEVTLLETFPDEEALCAAGPEGAFTHQIFVPFARAAESTNSHAVTVLEPSTKCVAPTVRTFAPGSEWLYFKIYTGQASADSVLRSALGPVIRAASAENLAAEWFFIRYGDPSWHLRVRFHGEPGALLGQLLPRIHEALAPFHANGLVWRTQLDTYERELERYGGAAGIELSEQLFCADSDAVLGIVETVADDEDGTERRHLALRSADMILDDFGLTLAAKRQQMESMRDGYFREFKLDAAGRRSLGHSFRKERRTLEAVLDRSQDAASRLKGGLELFARRSARIVPIAKELHRLAALGALSRSTSDLLSSYIHIHTNRVLQSQGRRQELVIYDHLWRLYDGQLARQVRR